MRYFLGKGRAVRMSDSNNAFCCIGPDSCRHDPVIKSLKPGVPFTTIDLVESSGIVVVRTPLSPTSADPTPGAIQTRLGGASTASSGAEQLDSVVRSASNHTSSEAKIATLLLSPTISSVSQLHHSTDSDTPKNTPFASPTVSSAVRSPDSHASQNQIDIGLSVSIPVGVVALVCFIVYLWFRRRRQGKTSRISSNEQIEVDRPGVDYRSMGFAPAELDEPERKAAPGELASESRHTRVKVVGASADLELHELPTSRGEHLRGPTELAGVAVEKPLPLAPGSSA